jgi:6-phosphofructokinase 1
VGTFKSPGHSSFDILLVRNEAASSVYTTDFITKMLKEEGADLFDARSASLGHTLQGGIPSPTDRARAVRLSLKCMAFIEKYHEVICNQHSKVKHATPETAAVITIQGSAIKWVPVQEMVQHADMTNRRGTQARWEGIKQLVETLVGLPQLSGLHLNDS